jgi:hypothetical protein
MAFEQASAKGVVRDFPREAIIRWPLLELEEVQLFRGVVKNLVGNAMTTLESMEGASKSAEYQENYHLLHHYLDYLKRFCEAKV